MQAFAEQTAPRKRGRPRDHAADGRILSAAADLILAQGFDRMTVDAVAARARVGKATVYRRWSKKEDLAVAAMAHLYSQDVATPDTGSVRDDLRASYSRALAFVNSTDGAAYFRTSVTESVRDSRIATLYRRANAMMEEAAYDVFRRGIARGEVRPDLNLPVAVQWLTGILVLRVITGQEPPPEDELDDLVSLVLDGAGHR